MFCELVYQTIKENTPCLRTEHICLERSYGRVAVSDYYATKVVKEFDSSKVDGYAIQSADTLEATQLTGVEISIVNEVAAGDANHIPIAAYQGVRIMTGAPLPVGADCVVPYEEVTVRGDKILVSSYSAKGQFVEPRGTRLQKGARILKGGSNITEKNMSLLASVGLQEVEVFRSPRIAIIPIGSELVSPGNPLGLGKIYDTNSVLLAGLLSSTGCACQILPIVSDSEQKIIEALQVASSAFDLIITSGGSGRGAYDLMEVAVEAAGAKHISDFEVHPGRYQVYGTVSGIPVLCLPGSPGAARIGFELFGRYAIGIMSGKAHTMPPSKALHNDLPEGAKARNHVHACYFARLEESGQVTLSSKSNPLAEEEGILIMPKADAGEREAYYYAYGSWS